MIYSWFPRLQRLSSALVVDSAMALSGDLPRVNKYQTIPYCATGNKILYVPGSRKMRKIRHEMSVPLAHSGKEI